MRIHSCNINKENIGILYIIKIYAKSLKFENIVYSPQIKHGITRKCIKTLAIHNFPLLIVTKSDLVLKDMDIFKKTRTVVSMTITTPSEEVAKIIEPYAPLPERRITALQKIIENEIPAVVRIDPIIPSINDGVKDLEKLVSILEDVGARQVTISTVKPVRGFFSYLRQGYPIIYEKLSSIYGDGRWLSGYKYLSEEKRLRILEKLRPIVLKHGLHFASCRDGFPQYNGILCDGSAYCRESLDDYSRVGY